MAPPWGPGGRHDNDHASITDIKVMPTYAEVTCNQKPYLPTTHTDSWMEKGLNGLLERQFRLFRENSVGPMRDAARSFIARGRVSGTEQYTTVWPSVHINQARMDRKNGFMFEATIAQPRHLLGQSVQTRHSYWYKRGILEPGTVVCFINPTLEDIVFSEVTDPWGNDPQELRKRVTNDKFARVNFQVIGFDEADVTNLVKSMSMTSAHEPKPVMKVAHELCMLEFPGVLIPGFYYTLAALQDIKRKQNLPLSEFIIPEDVTPDEAISNHADDEYDDVFVEFPEYALSLNFDYNTQSLLKDKPEQPHSFSPDAPLDVMVLQGGASSLDDTQAIALNEALSHSLALIQGPPGTGKSYTGEKIIDVLLDTNQIRIVKKDPDGNYRSSAPGCVPVLCVCYTNHALDQLLENLVQKGIRDVVRIGSQSKSDILRSRNLRVLANARKQGKPKELREKTTQANEGCDIMIRAVMNEYSIVRGYSDKPNRIQDYLHDTNYSYVKDLFGSHKQETQDDVLKSETIFFDWLAGGGTSKEGTKKRSLKTLLSTKPHELSNDERQRLLNSWRKVLVDKAIQQCTEEYRGYKKYAIDRSACLDESDLTVLQTAKVIGITTSGLAKCRNMLEMLAPKVLLIEEAGEILEAHTLTALIPSIEHAILIGDHQQLRPQIERYDLSSESDEGEKYSLDISLFERLVHPPYANYVKLPYSTLLTQRRMHPSISELIRKTLYPGLIDGDNVLPHPPVVGMKHRLFWLDHNSREGSGGAGGTSHVNEFEVEMVHSIVSYILKQQAYALRDIAVLTPYLGQLSKLKHRLSKYGKISLHEKDAGKLKEVVGDDEDEDEDEDKLRIATIDNFQGEEAKVVIISLVRSNSDNRVGFLKTSNRTNVLLSRAKHGMYIVGNSRTAASVPMWAQVINILKKKGKLANHGREFRDYLEAWKGDDPEPEYEPPEGVMIRADPTVDTTLVERFLTLQGKPVPPNIKSSHELNARLAKLRQATSDWAKHKNAWAKKELEMQQATLNEMVANLNGLRIERL